MADKGIPIILHLLWARFHQSQLYSAGPWLWPAPGVHHAALPAAKRHGGTSYQNA